jgi:hypothetical protein
MRNREAFFEEVQVIAKQMDDLIDKYEVRDEVVCLFLTGSITEDEDGDTTVQAVYGMNIRDDEELDDVMDFFKHVYEMNKDLGDEPDWGSFLDDFGIGLN